MYNLIVSFTLGVYVSSLLWSPPPAHPQPQKHMIKFTDNFEIAVVDDDRLEIRSRSMQGEMQARIIVNRGL